MQLSLEQMKRLAEIVCTDRFEIRQHKDGTVMLEGYYSHATGVPDKWIKPEVFNPSLTGEDWQQAQALDVLTALAKKPVYLERWCSNAGMIKQALTDGNLGPCALALLGDKT